MSKRYLTVYNLQREKDWVLKNACDIVETQEINTVYSLEFTIPMNEDDMEHCQPNWYVRYGEEGQLYRFTDQLKTNDSQATVTYHCEHVIATLSDDVMYQGPHSIGGIGHYTKEVLNFILSKQTVQNWVLGTCDQLRQFEYSWENENLLAALWSVPTCFATPYMWTFDTSSYPWKINLVTIDENGDPNFYLMARKNILRSTEESSNLDICTRLYGLGEGEGVNQLTIKSVNNGLPYIQSSPEVIAKYGIVSRIFVDRRYQSPETLKARMETLLKGLEVPSMKREFEIVDLYDLSPDDMYKAEIGSIVLLKDDNTKVYITKTVKNHSVAGDMKITIATKVTDISSSIADLADRQRIEQVYSQGASQVYSFSFFGNATSDYPLDGYVYFPDDLKYLNEVKLKVMLSPFRSYSKASSELGGGYNNTLTISIPERIINESISAKKTTQMTAEANQKLTTTENGGATGETSTSGGGNIDVSFSGTVGETTDTNWTTNSTAIRTMKVNLSDRSTYDTELHANGRGVSGLYVNVAHGHKISGNVETIQPDGSDHIHGHGVGSLYIEPWWADGRPVLGDGWHEHSIQDVTGHSHAIQRSELKHYHPVSISAKKGNVTGSAAFAHSHKFSIGNHSHVINIGHQHTYDISHSHKITIPAQNFTIDIPKHDHKLEAGIFESGYPTQADIYINGVYKCRVTNTNTEINITDYLLNNGKVPRGQWIKISVKPSDDAPNNMAYISVFGNTFAFIQSYTGGNY